MTNPGENEVAPESAAGVRRLPVPPLASLDIAPPDMPPEAPTGILPQPADRSGDWERVRAVIRRALKQAASGDVLANPVVEALSAAANSELVTRWLQALCLLPGVTAEALFNSLPAKWRALDAGQMPALALRRSLLPYLYSTLALSGEYGWPVIRSLSALEPQFPSLREVDDVFLLGENLLAAPVVRPGATTREFPLPHGVWVDWWTGRTLEGGRRVTVDAPLNRLPLFVRSGAVVPLLPANATPGSRYVLRVYPGRHETVIYEDAGQGTRGERGDYRFVYLTCTRDGRLVSLSRRVAGAFQPADEKITVEVVGLTAEPAEVRADRRGAPLWFYNNGTLEIPLTDEFAQLEIVLQQTT
ncbi:MAG: glycoside hydrolase family 31 protein [Chloroflexota bacterium]